MTFEHPALTGFQGQRIASTFHGSAICIRSTSQLSSPSCFDYEGKIRRDFASYSQLDATWERDLNLKAAEFRGSFHSTFVYKCTSFAFTSVGSK